jgi:hypothetical protein
MESGAWAQPHDAVLAEVLKAVWPPLSCIEKDENVDGERRHFLEA